MERDPFVRSLFFFFFFLRRVEQFVPSCFDFSAQFLSRVDTPLDRAVDLEKDSLEDDTRTMHGGYCIIILIYNNSGLVFRCRVTLQVVIIN